MYVRQRQALKRADARADSFGELQSVNLYWNQVETYSNNREKRAPAWHPAFFVFTFRSNVKKRGCFQKDTLCWQPFSVMQDPLAGSGALKGTVDKAAHMAGYCAKADNRPANIRAAAKPKVMPVCACPKHPNGFDKAGFRRRAPAGGCDPALFRGR